MFVFVPGPWSTVIPEGRMKPLPFYSNAILSKGSILRLPEGYNYSYISVYFYSGI